MNLTEFLVGRPGTNTELLAIAAAATEVRGSFISANTMNGLLVVGQLYTALYKLKNLDGHPAQDSAGAFLDPRSTDYNFIIGDPTGDAQIANLDGLIGFDEETQSIPNPILITFGERTVNVSEALLNLKPIFIGLCNKPTLMFPNVSLYDVIVAKNEQDRFTEVNLANINTIDKDWLLVRFEPSRNPQFAAHTPAVYTVIHGEKKYLNRFEKPITEDGNYKVFVNKNRGQLFVDDIYGVVV